MYLGFHWINRQCTIHPFVLHYFKNGKAQYKTYCVLSDSLCHDASTVNVFIAAFIRGLNQDIDEEKLNKIEHIHYVSDGTGAQYKNIKNIVNLCHHKNDHKITAEWHFTATAHGKSTCDAINAVVKMYIRRQSLRGELIKTPRTMFEKAVAGLTKPELVFIYVTQADIDEAMPCLKARYELAKTIPGTRSFHYFKPISENEIIAKKYSSATRSERKTAFKLPVAEESDVEEPDVEEQDEVEQEVIEENEEVIFKVGEYVAIKIGTGFQVGLIYEEEDGDLKLQMMIRKGKSFQWPDPEKLETVSPSDIVSIVEAPTTATGRLYQLTKDEYKRLEDLTKKPKK